MSQNGEMVSRWTHNPKIVGSIPLLRSIINKQNNMQIDRKTYSKIITLLKAKELTTDDALELADDICLLMEKTTIEIWVTWHTSDIWVNKEPTKVVTSDNTPKKRVFKPYEKVVWGQVDGNWVFTPIQPWSWLGWISENWVINKELTSESMK